MIKIVTDSTSYLPEKYIKEYDISIVSLGVTWSTKTERELDVNLSNFYEELEKSGEIPKSSHPSPDELYMTFENIIKEGNSIVAIFLSSEMSGAYTSAHLVKEMILEKYPEAEIELIDSRTNCMQLGYIALTAAKAAAEGQSIKEVVDAAKFTISHSRFLFTPETLTYLKKGGRIGSASALLGTLLQIKPILTVNNGKTDVYTKVRTKKKAVEALIDGLMKDLESHKLLGVTVHHINAQAEGEALAQKLSERLDIHVDVQSIGPVIGLHVGPGSIGLAYHYA